MFAVQKCCMTVDLLLFTPVGKLVTGSENQISSAVGNASSSGYFPLSCSKKWKNNAETNVLCETPQWDGQRNKSGLR